VACVAGCSCTPVTVDCFKPERVSLLAEASIAVTQAEACKLLLKVLNETSSPDGGRKVKMLGAKIWGYPQKTAR